MIGFSELIIPGLIFLAVIVFGKKTFLNFYKDMKGMKKDMKKIDNEINEDMKQINNNTKELIEIKN